jgi:pimeloyl-ACP methyl ester carboxylesterase
MRETPADWPAYGRFENRLPYYRTGDGPTDLLVIPGLSDAFDGKPNLAIASALERTYGGLTDDYTVWTVGRPRGMETETTTRDLAGVYSTFLDELDGANVLGYSLGGLIAQYLAVDYPDFVDRLVLAAAADHLGEGGVSTVTEWAEMAAAGEWGRLYASTARESYVGWRKDALAPVLRAFGGVVRPRYPDDVLVSLDAALEHDGSDVLGEIDAPTMVVGGSEDRLFPEERLRATKEAIPDAKLALVRGAGHGVMEEHRNTFNDLVRLFVAGEPLQ